MSVDYIKERLEDFWNLFTKTLEERQAIRIRRALRKAQEEQGHREPPSKGSVM